MGYLRGELAPGYREGSKTGEKINNSVWNFCVQQENAFQSLLVEPSIHPEAKEAVNHVPGFLYGERLCGDVCARFSLNDSQRHAVELTAQKKLSLIEGPPGTGKSQTAAAIVAVNSELNGFVAAVAPTNFAADCLAVRCLSKNVPIWRFGFADSISVHAREQLLPFNLHHIVETSLEEYVKTGRVLKTSCATYSPDGEREARFDWHVCKFGSASCSRRSDT